MISKVSIKDEQISFLFSGSPREANILRRIFLSEIPTLAIEKVEMFNNTSVRTDEFLIHRVELIPVLKGHAGGVMELFPDSLVIKSQDFKDSSEENRIMKNIIITKLNPWQKLSMKIHIGTGTGQKHVKWSAVSIAFFRATEKENVQQFTVHTLHPKGQYEPNSILEKAIKIYEIKCSKTE